MRNATRTVFIEGRGTGTRYKVLGEEVNPRYAETSIDIDRQFVIYMKRAQE